jgi:anti-sigma regulatory factor (Ser/Thr protein kinase)
MNNENRLIEHYNIEAGNFNAAGDASAAIKDLLKRLGINTQLVRRISIASYEAELNIIIHSYGGQLTLSVNRDMVVLQATDTGPGIADVEKAMMEGFSTAPDSIRELGFGAGMGLPNMERCASGFEIQSSPQGTVITMNFQMR